MRKNWHVFVFIMGETKHKKYETSVGKNRDERKHSGEISFVVNDFDDPFVPYILGR